MSSEKYNVGQVVYLLNQKKLSIIPALVVEEITRKTVDEVTKEYIIELPDAKRTRVVCDDVKTMIFSDVDALRNFMIDNSKRSIDSMIRLAIDKKEEFFNGSYIAIESDKKSQEVLDVFMRKKENIGKIKQKSTKKDVQINAKNDIIVNESNKANGEKPKEKAAE